MQDKNLLNTIIATTGTILTHLMGGWDQGIKILGLLIIIDYITGVLVGINKGNLSSEVGWRGIIKKAGIFFVIILAHQLDTIALSDGPIFKTMACFFYIANEGISITENIAGLGVPLPNVIIEALENLKEANEGSGLEEEQEKA